MTISISKFTLLATLGGIVPVTAVANIIDNGTVQLGINDAGNLVTDGIGLTFLPTGGEALAPGCACEGWGLSDITTSQFGKAGETFGYTNITGATITTSGTGSATNSIGDSSTSMVTITDGTFVFDVEHAFSTSDSPNLYQVDVTTTNMGADVGELVYRRAMDWDVPPTEFNEYVTIQGWPASRLRGSSDDGFADGNPNVPLTAVAGDAVVDGNFTDSGPADHGAAFDFTFGSVPAGASEGFTIFYGATASEGDALIALADVGAEVYSLGQPSSPDGDTLGVPNTFIFAFAGVGGTPVDRATTGSSSAAIAADLPFLTANHHLDVSSRRFDNLGIGMGDGAAVGEPVVTTSGSSAKDSGPTFQLSTLFSKGSVDHTTNNPGFDLKTRYLGVSADHSIPGGNVFEDALVGIAFGHESISLTRGDDLGDGDGTVRSVSIYSGGTNANGLFGDVNLMLSDLDYDLTRQGILDTYEARVDGRSTAGRLRVGYNLDAETTGFSTMKGTIGVYGEMTRLHTAFDDFSEDNNGLTTAGFTKNSNLIALGTRYSYNNVVDGMRQFGHIDIAAMVDTMNDDFSVNQTTVGGNEIQRQIDGRDGVMGRLGASFGFEDKSGWYGDVKVGGTFGGDFSEGSVGLRVGRTF